jgi:peptidyl-prolyl cis-trans isomerase A (cyclophilin A)
MPRRVPRPLDLLTPCLVAGALAGGPALADTATPAAATADHRNEHLSLGDATKGLKGKGALIARLDVETKGLKGTFNCELFEDKAPKTVANFVALARGLRYWKDPKTGEWQKRPLYDGTVFHRVIPEFMIQGGDPQGTGRGDPGYEFEDEFSADLKLDKGGVLAMANRGPGTNGSQFFITEKETPWLTGRHTVFGQCDNVTFEKQLARVPTAPGNRPLDAVMLKKVTIQRGKK